VFRQWERAGNQPGNVIPPKVMNKVCVGKGTISNTINGATKLKPLVEIVAVAIQRNSSAINPINAVTGGAGAASRAHQPQESTP